MEETMPQSVDNVNVSNTTMPKQLDASTYLISHFADEITSAEDYFNLAQDAYTMGQNQMVKYLMMMVDDECSHAEFILKIAMFHNVQLSAADMQHFEELKVKIEQFR